MIAAFQDFVENNAIRKANGKWSTQDSGYSNNLTNEELAYYWGKEYNNTYLTPPKIKKLVECIK